MFAVFLGINIWPCFTLWPLPIRKPMQVWWLWGPWNRVLACAAQQVTQRNGAGLGGVAERAERERAVGTGLLMKSLSPSIWRSGKRPKSDSGEARMEGRKDSENCLFPFQPSVATGGPWEEVFLQIRS